MKYRWREASAVDVQVASLAAGVSIVNFSALARAIVTVVVTAAAASCGQDNRYAAPPPPKVTVAIPIEQQVIRYFEATGNTAAINTVDLVARVQGFVQAISYADGDYVKKAPPCSRSSPSPT